MEFDCILPFTASFTDIRSLSGMELHVCYEMPLERERFSTFLKADGQEKHLS